MSNVPQGRGHRTGPDRVVDFNEAHDLRKRMAPGSQGWVLSTIDSPIANRHEQGNVVKSEIRLFYLGQLTTNYTIAQSRIKVGTSDSGQTLTAALYVYNISSGNMTKIGASQADFDLSSVVQVTHTYGVPFSLRAGARMFLGTVASGGSGTAQVNSAVIHGGCSCRTISGTLLPSNVERLEALSTGTGYVPGVVFLDVKAKDIF